MRPKALLIRNCSFCLLIVSAEDTGYLLVCTANGLDQMKRMNSCTHIKSQTPTCHLHGVYSRLCERFHDVTLNSLKVMMPSNDLSSEPQSDLDLLAGFRDYRIFKEQAGRSEDLFLGRLKGMRVMTANILEGLPEISESAMLVLRSCSSDCLRVLVVGDWWM